MTKAKQLQRNKKKQRRRIITLLHKLWEKNSTLRCLQLLGNIFRFEDTYYVDDEALEYVLRRELKKEIK